MVCKKTFNQIDEALDFVKINKIEKYVITEIDRPELLKKEYVLEYKEKENA